MGVLAANGIGLPAFWDSLVQARSGIAPITLFDASTHRIKLAGEVKGFQFSDYGVSSIKERRHGRHTLFALAATRMAMTQARLTVDDLRALEPVPIAVGISTSAMDVIEHNEDVLQAKGPDRVSPFGVSSCLPHAVSSVIGDDLGISNQRFTFSSACSAGLDALALAAELIRAGKSDLVIAGGMDAPVTPLAVASFGKSGLMPPLEAHMERCSRPFDRQRIGGILAEGGGMFIVERWEHAEARGIKPLAEILGYGNCADASGTPPGAGLARSMAVAISNSGLMPADIDYVCAHGPSDPVIDRVETEMIKQVMGQHAYRIPVSSIKGVTGNPLAGAGPLQVAACAQMFGQDTVSPTANYEEPDPDCDLDYVPNKPYAMSINRALINLHGLGGGNSSLVVQRVA